MRMVKTIAGMRKQVRDWRRAGLRVGLVPTMGSLHAGHLSLVERARREVGRAGKVVVSIYVNPTQFGPNEDFSRYPRDLAGDARLCRAAGVDAIFAPPDTEMYPGRARGDFSCYVVEEELSRPMEGASRPTHFRGVTTVVAKLFNIVTPEVAVFGAKDWQQAAVLKRMVRDLNFPLKLVVAPTMREGDGLAMSSRNRYLAGDLREQALALSRAMARAREMVRKAGKPVPAGRLREELKRVIAAAPDAQIDYIEFFDPETLAALERVGSGARVGLAVRVGNTRLIDNSSL
jgi:pantoate--beta-alanine ligase